MGGTAFRSRYGLPALAEMKATLIYISQGWSANNKESRSGRCPYPPAGDGSDHHPATGQLDQATVKATARHDSPSASENAASRKEEPADQAWPNTSNANGRTTRAAWRSPKNR